jgi:hypothetical protein
MSFFPVRFDDELLLRPEQIGLNALSPNLQFHVAAGHRQTFFNQKGEESRLEAAAQHRTLHQRTSPRSQNRTQPRCPAPASAREDAIYLFHIQHSQDRCLLDKTPHRAPSDLPSHIDQGSGGSSAWDPAPNFDLVSLRQAHTVPANARDLAARPVRRNDLHYRQLLGPTGGSTRPRYRGRSRSPRHMQGRRRASVLAAQQGDVQLRRFPRRASGGCRARPEAKSPGRSARASATAPGTQPHTAALPTEQSRGPHFRCAFCSPPVHKAHRSLVRPRVTLALEVNRSRCGATRPRGA